jgi:hypothetical protein
VLSLAAVPGVGFLLLRPSFYEVAISSGYCFVMAGFLLAARAMGHDPNKWASLVGSGFCFGLASGCRPNLAVVAALIVGLVAIHLWAYKTRVLAFAGPVILCGLLLGVYNYIRFQNPFEFGMHYVLLSRRSGLAEHFGYGLRNLLPSLGTVLLSPLVLIQSDRSLGFFPTMGLFWGCPLAVLGLCTPVVLLDGRVKSYLKLTCTGFNVDCLYLSSLCTLVMLAVLGFTGGRYLVDFTPELVLLSCCLVVVIWQTMRWLPPIWQLAFGLLLAVAVLYSSVIAISICMLRFTH